MWPWSILEMAVVKISVKEEQVFVCFYRLLSFSELLHPTSDQSKADTSQDRLDYRVRKDLVCRSHSVEEVQWKLQSLVKQYHHVHLGQGHVSWKLLLGNAVNLLTSESSFLWKSGDIIHERVLSSIRLLRLVRPYCRTISLKRYNRGPLSSSLISSSMQVSLVFSMILVASAPYSSILASWSSLDELTLLLSSSATTASAKRTWATPSRKSTETSHSACPIWFLRAAYPSISNLSACASWLLRGIHLKDLW